MRIASGVRLAILLSVFVLAVRVSGALAQKPVP